MLHFTPGLITIENVMFFGLGFLLALLAMLAFMPAVHRRAVRLTKRKYDIVPQNARELQSEKDRLRADFAMSTRKLEHEIDKMQHKAAEHLTDLARKSDAVAKLKETLDGRDTLIAQLQEQNAALKTPANEAAVALPALRAEVAAKTAALRTADQRIVALMGEINALNAALSERAATYNTQQREIAALTQKSDTLRREIEALSQPVPAPRVPMPAAPLQPAAAPMQPAAAPIQPAAIPLQPAAAAVQPVAPKPAAQQQPVQAPVYAAPAARQPAAIPSPALIPLPQANEIRLPEPKDDGDVIRRALEAIEASGIHIDSAEWTNSNGAVPFGH